MYLLIWRLLTVAFALFITIVRAQTQVCNNAAALCSRNYNNITHLGAHDSPFVRNSTNGFSIAGDQVYTSLQQLDSGVRLLSAQLHKVTGADGQPDWRLCHTLCQLYDAGTLLDWLKGIKGWLDAHHEDVVTILLVNSDDADATTLGGIYSSAGLSQYSYQPDSTTIPRAQWPTLSTLISQNKRLINFIANLPPANNTVAPYLLDEFTFAFENNYDNVLPISFSCEPQRPSQLNGNAPAALASGYLPIMNHFRYDNLSGIEVPSVENVDVTNAPNGGPGNLGAAAANCSAFYGRAPTFILTDFSNVGPAIETVDRLNGVSGQTSGRLALPDSIVDSEADPNPTSAASPAATSGQSGTTTGSSTAISAQSSTLAGSSTAAAGSPAATSTAKSEAHAVSPVLGRAFLVGALGFAAGPLLNR